MPYTGDSPTNPVALTLSGGAATGVASSASEHDRHVCWFSIPAQAAGMSVELTTLIGTDPVDTVDVVMLWAGSANAHYVNDTRDGVRQMVAYRALPAGVEVLIGLIPRGVLRPPGRSVVGGTAGGGASVAAWSALMPPDLTRRLPADLSLSLTVAATTAPVGSPTNRVVVSFLSSQDPVFVDMSSWTTPVPSVEFHLPAGYALRVSDGLGITDNLVCTGVLDITPPRGEQTFRPGDIGGTDPVITPIADYPLPSGGLTLTPVVVADLAGTAFDSDGVTPEPANVLLFRLADAVLAMEAPTGTHALPNVTAGDYIAVAFSRVDNRDVRATNVLVPPAERAVGGGFAFPPPPDPGGT